VAKGTVDANTSPRRGGRGRAGTCYLINNNTRGNYLTTPKVSEGTRGRRTASKGKKNEQQTSFAERGSRHAGEGESLLKKKGESKREGGYLKKAFSRYYCIWSVSPVGGEEGSFLL